MSSSLLRGPNIRIGQARKPGSVQFGRRRQTRRVQQLCRSQVKDRRPLRLVSRRGHLMEQVHTICDSRIRPHSIFFAFIERYAPRPNTLDDLTWVFLQMLVTIVPNKLWWLAIAVFFIDVAFAEVSCSTGKTVMSDIVRIEFSDIFI